MNGAAFAALAASVLLHVAWNLMARRTEPDARFLWWALSGWLVLVGPWSLVMLALYAEWSWRLALLLGITCAAEAMYFLTLGTSVYSTANKLAVPALPGYGVMLGYVTVTFLAAWLALTWENHRHRRRLAPKLAPHPFQWIVGGLCIGNAYALVIYAMQFTPAAYVVAFTNAGIVLAGVIAMVAFREREHWRARLAAMAAICTGLVLVATA